MDSIMSKLTAEWDANGVGSTQEVLSDRGDLATIADRDGTVVAVGVVVRRLLVVLETLHERQEVVGGPALHLEVVYGVPSAL